MEARESMDRRKALQVIIGVGGAAGAATVGVPALITGLSPGFKRRGETWRSLGPVEDFPVGEVTQGLVEVPREDWARGLRVKLVYVWRPGDEFVVYSRNCTDVGCPVNWDPGSECFLCPCHGGIFLKDGTPIAGPPPRPLYRYTNRVRNGVLEIDLSSLPPMT